MKSEIGILARQNPKKAAAQIRRALRDGQGVVGAAEVLGVTRQTVWRWIQKLDAAYEYGLAEHARKHSIGSGRPTNADYEAQGLPVPRRGKKG